MSSLEKELKERAECLFQQKQLGKVVHDYRAKEKATRQVTFKLRVEHLAREQCVRSPRHSLKSKIRKRRQRHGQSTEHSSD
jgi:hypothetical protein